MKKSYVLLSCIFGFFSMAINANDLENKDPVNQIMDSYIELVNSMEKDNSITKVLNLFSEQYSGNTTYVNLSGGVVKKSYTKESVKKQLNDILDDENYKLNLKMNKVLYSTQKKGAGTISALLDFESFIDENSAEKGTILMNIVVVDQKGAWKIIQNNMVRVSEVKDIGDCVCHIFEKGNTQFVTELYYPAGVKYDHKFQSFRVASNENDRIIKTAGNIYVWQNDSSKLMLDKEELGVAKDPKQAIQLLIERLNSESCTSIFFR